MKNINTVLKEWAIKISLNVPEYDFEESAIAQYGDELEWEAFFVDIAHSRGWSRIVKERDFQNEEEATDYMVILLDKAIENLR